MCLPPSTPGQWNGIIQRSKAAGLNTIQTYVFWDLHEPSPGQYNFAGQADLVGFLKLCQARELELNLLTYHRQMRCTWFSELGRSYVLCDGHFVCS
jgi:hypothetical protein